MHELLERFISFVIVLIFASALSQSVRADIAPEPLLTGGAGLSAHGDPVAIAMRSEVVDLSPSAARNTVEATFVLANTSDKAVDLEVGFPSYFEMPLQEFAASVDGKDVTAAVKKEGPEGPKKIFTYWMCWPMSFAPGQERTVTVKYWVKSESSRWLTATSGGNMTQVAGLCSDLLPESMRDQGGARVSGYVLRTGAGWQGTIGKVTVHLHHGAGFEEASLVGLTSSDAWKLDPETHVRTLVRENLEPTADDDITYQWRLTSAADERAFAMKAIQTGQLSFEAQQNILEVLGWRAVGNKPQAASAQQLEAMKYTVAPLGPAFVPAQAQEYVQFTFYHAVYPQVLATYRSAGKTDEAQALAQQYAKFLVAAAEQRKEEMSEAREESDQKIYAKQAASLEAELKALSAAADGK